MDRSKVLDKIQKCLALGKSPNEHEAAAALRQAQKMMELHGITEKEIGAIGYTYETVNTTIQAGKAVPVGISRLASLIIHAFGVRGVIGRSVRVTEANFDVTYFGPEGRVMLATYAHTVVSRAMESAWKRYLNDNPHMKGATGARAGFQLGWLTTVQSTLQAFAVTDEEKAGTDLVVEQKYGRELFKAKPNNQRVYGSTLAAGERAGEGFKLHRPVNGSSAAAPLRIAQ